MNFIANKEDLSKTIKSYKSTGNNYKVVYMDGSEANFYCSDENFGNQLRETMIKQAIERQKTFNIDFYDKIGSLYTALLMVDLGVLWPTLAYGDAASASLVLVALASTTVASVKVNKKIRELKKYKLFLEMVDDIELINSSDILKSIEFENIYLKPFDIDTLDDYTYGEVKTIHKELKLKKQ